VSGIPSERATEIQNALIKRGYLDGPATGQWDDNSVDAMKQFQSDNGFPVTGQPSAPALKRLGVSKRPQDGYAVPVTSVAARDSQKGTEQEKPKKPPQL
jgi:peptidoglycan hydrolase-like protein with peptidoglycan-binding domain